MSGSTGGIGAPSTVPEGTNSPVQIMAPGSRRVIITNINTGEEFERQTGASGSATFDLPATWVSGHVITIVDKADPTRSTSILVTPATM